MTARGILVAMALVALTAGCNRSSPPPNTIGTSAGEEIAWPPEKLSAYGLFVGPMAEHRPAAGVMPYDLNSPLFSDYTLKHRFVRLPQGQAAEYDATEAFAFPVGTIVAKTFAYPVDARDPASGQRLLETRILAHRPEGWVGLPYIWNAEQTEATLEVAGDLLDATWIDADGQTRTNRYMVPNVNQCKGCHLYNNRLELIGPKARHLNRAFDYATGQENQLAHWTTAGILTGAPPADQAPKLAVWDDPATGTLDQRARAWLEINCAHCHNPAGPGGNSGLDLLAAQTTPAKFGVFKSPVSAGRGSGGRSYGIVPGKPDESILLFRVDSSEAQIMMPELGRRLIHREGVELVRQWIAAMDEKGVAQ